jgi:polysaccharide biosynthesis/export protein
MKPLWRVAGRGIVLSGILWAGLFLAGCGTKPTQFAPLPSELETSTKVGSSDMYRIGDAVAISFSGTVSTEPLLQPYVETIKEDGTINPPLIGSVVAAARTPGDLQKEVQDRYNKLYKNLTVTIITQARYYYVTGEVRKPGPEPYLGETDIIKAISAAGDFTDFASKRSVRVTRADGRTEIVNVLRAIDDPQYDVPIYPGDKIVIKRRWL